MEEGDKALITYQRQRGYAIGKTFQQAVGNNSF
jgi:hypothetical protein